MGDRVAMFGILFSMYIHDIISIMKTRKLCQTFYVGNHKTLKTIFFDFEHKDGLNYLCDMIDTYFAM